MYLYDYIWFACALIVCAVLAGLASSKVNSAFNRYNSVYTRSGMTGYDTAARLMRANDIQGISIGRIGGKLTDHYDPKKCVVNLSEATYSSASVASVAVAAHEMGHVMQKEKGYLFFNIRTALVPIVNFGSRLALPLVLVGFVIDLLTQASSYSVGFYIALVGVVLYGGSLLFMIITLPVELNASKRAKRMLVAEGILDEDELQGASKVLSAAAMTYVASMLTSLVYFLRFFVYVLTIFGRRNRK